MLYPIAIEEGNEDQAFGVVVPDIPGCFSAGDSLEEAFRNAKEAIELHLGALAEEGELPPAASPLSKVRTDEEFSGWVLGFVEVDEEPFLGKSHKINVTLPDLLTVKIDAFVKANPEYKNRSKFLQLAALAILQAN